MVARATRPRGSFGARRLPGCSRTLRAPGPCTSAPGRAHARGSRSRRKSRREGRASAPGRGLPASWWREPRVHEAPSEHDVSPGARAPSGPRALPASSWRHAESAAPSEHDVSAGARAPSGPRGRAHRCRDVHTLADLDHVVSRVVKGARAPRVEGSQHRGGASHASTKLLRSTTSPRVLAHPPGPGAVHIGAVTCTRSRISITSQIAS